MAKYDLVGVDGNAFMVMGYTAQALKNEGLKDDVPEMQSRATSGDYNNLLSVCVEYIDKANKAAEQNDIDDDDFVIDYPITEAYAEKIIEKGKKSEIENENKESEAGR